MKKRILAMLLAIVMLVGALPINAFATEATDPAVVLCETEGCEYASGHEGNCSNYVAPTEACTTEGCTYGANHEGNCSNYVAPTEACATEGCTYGANHEGDCSNYVAPTEACATEGCTYGANHEGDCSNYVAPTECETEGCTSGYGHEGDCGTSSDEEADAETADQAAAQNVIDLITAIGEVTLESEAAIAAADAAYNNLTDAQKVLVTNLDVLETAKSTYSALTVPAPVEAAADATVYVTVNNKGVLGKANDGSIMVNRSVTVTDINADGVLSYDEALVAAHAAYNSASGYVTNDYEESGKTVTKLWGVDNGVNYLFFINGSPITMNVAESYVAAGNSLYISVLSEMTFGADWYTYFDKTNLTVKAGEEFALTLKGYQGRSDNPAAVAVSGASVGTWQSGSFSAIEGKTTDANGAVTLSFDKAGTYYVTASGTVSDTVYGMTVECPTMAPVCVVTVEAVEVPVESITLNKTELPLCVGNSNTLKATVLPEGNAVAVTWSSSNEKIATVENGKITAVAVGEVTITATAGDKSTECKVTVTEPPRLGELRVSKEWSDNGNYYTLTPAFDPLVTTYTLAVPDYAPTVFPYAKLAEGTEGKGLCYYGFNSMFGGFVWTSGNNVNVSGGYFGVVIYDKANSMSTEDIRYTVNFGKVATLKTLTVDGVGSLAFNRDTNSGYHYYVDSTQNGVDITATGYKSNYTVTIGGNTVTNGETYRLAYNWDENGRMEVPVTVSGENVAENTYTLVLEKQPLNDAPFILVQPVDADYTVISTVTDLSVKASANGELAYQWYYNTTDSTENGTLIEGATTATYTPPITEDVIGTRYYYCVITNTGKTEGNVSVSSTACVTVDPDPTPIATITNPGEALTGYDWATGYVYTAGAEATPLTVTATAKAEGGTFSYRWYRVSVPYGVSSGSSPGGSAITETYTPPTTLNRADDTGRYYACKVTYTFKNKSYSAWATTGSTYTDADGKSHDVNGVFVYLTVDSAAVPTISTQPASASYMTGDTAKALSVRASRADGGTLTYQWYVNDTDSTEGGTPIEGATSNSYSLGTFAEASTKYYYCVVTNTIQGYTATVTSSAAKIEVSSTEALIGQYLTGSGTQDNPFLIENAQDYQDIYDLVAQGTSFSGFYLKQVNDITLPESWQPIGSSNALRFSGNLNGNGKTLTVPAGGLPLLGYVKGAAVTNLNIYGTQIAGYGLVNNFVGIGLSGTGIVIDNVTLKSGSSTLKSGLIGTYITTNGFAGCSAGFVAEIRNCTIEEGVVIGYDKSQSMIGSIAGRINGTIENCKSYATVYGTSYVGGILGTRDNAMGGCVVTNSQFHGTVVATGEHAGGIVGGGYSNSTAPNGAKVDINGCSATGSVTGADKVGGVIGGDTYVVQLWGGHTLQNNSFTGTVSATDGTYVGGVIGFYNSLNVHDGISGNYYVAGCGADKGIGFVQYVDTNCADHETASGATYVNTADGESGVGGMTKTGLNRTDDPLGADTANLCYTDTADLLTSESVSVSTIHEDASTGNAVTLSFDEQTNTLSGKLSNYTELDAYNDGDISVVIANIPEGATAVLNNEAGEKVADFVNGVAVTTGSTVAASGKYIFKIVLTNGAKTESCDLVLEKTTTMKWKGLVFEGIPAFSENVIYHGHPEGTLFQLDADGNRTGATGLSDDCLHYEVYVNPLTTSVKPEGTKAMDYFKTSFVPNPANKKTSIYVDDELVIENAPTTMALALKIAQLENGFELSITKERTVLRVEFKISDTEVVYSTITFVRDVNVNVDTFVTMIEELDLKSMVYPDDVTSIDVVKEYYEALSDTQKTQIPAEIQSKFAAALEWAKPDRVPEKLEIVTAPAQVSYAAGDAFNPAGVELLATYSDGTTRTITPESEGFTVEPSGALTNETEVTFTYNTVKVSQPITVLTINWSGEGTEAVPYELYNAEDLQALYTYVASGKTTKGLHFKVMADITLPADWKPIGALIDPSVGNINSGKNVRPFSGTLDGNGKTITVPEGGLPLLGHVNGATVKNLNIYGKQIAGYGLVNNLEGVGLSGEAICIDNVTLKSGSSTLKSGLIGTYITSNMYAGCSATYYVTIKNCTIEEGVVIGYNKDQSMIGSIAGRIHGTIDNCVSYATVYGTSYVGGILGTRDNALGGCVVTNSQFHGTVAATGSNVGGIVGGGYPGSSAPNGYKININDCSASGSVTGADKVGGIVGADTGVVQLWGTHTLKNNSFTGTVKATDGTYVGGIIGYYASLNKYDDISGNYYKSGCGTDRGIGFVQYVDTSCQTHETAVGATYINTAEGKPDISGITKTDLNRTDDPLGADAAKLCYTDSTPVTATELKVSGNYKTEYTTGDKLDLSGIVLTVVYTDKSEETINLSDATVTGYDANKVGEQELTISYNGLTAAITVKVENPKGEIKVTVAIYGDSKHGDNGSVHTLAGGGLTTWVSTTTYTVDSNSTVWDVLQKAFADNGITCNAGSNNSQGTVYISALTRNGVTLAEFDNGTNSGWMYTLNGNHSDNGVAQQYLKDGDKIVFHYTDDYTKEQGSEGNDDEEKDAKAAEAAQKLIDAIGTVNLTSADEIEAARKAYDDLTYAQKQLVDNYATLTAAEAKYAQLKAADDEKKADAVEDLIDKISAGSTTFEDDVKAAQKAYNALTADQKKLVDNYSKLANALKELADEEDKEAAEAVEKLIKDLGTITLESEEDIKAAREAYDKLTDEQKALVENLADLEAAEEKLAALKADAVSEDIYKTTGDYIENLGTPVPGSVGGEWMVIGLIRSDREVPGADDYYASVVKYVQENIDENERLHSAKSTDNSRIIMALTAMGKDVTNVDGHNLLNGLNDMAFIQKQGINGPIWALIAFDSGNYPTPEGDVTREALIQVILDAQLADGGWALSGETSDADITGMAVQALAPYYENNADVKKALDEAIETLSKMQAADGSYGSIDGTSSESIAQVIVALAALGIDADKDERFVKNGISAVDALCAFYVEGGGFKHLMDGKLDGMATEQGYYALVAYFRMLDDKTSLYNMTDVMDMGGDVEAVEPTETLPAETEPAPTEPVQIEDDDKGGFPWWIIIALLIAGAVVVVIVNRKKIFASVR